MHENFIVSSLRHWFLIHTAISISIVSLSLTLDTVIESASDVGGPYRKYELNVLSPLRCILWWERVGVGGGGLVKWFKDAESKRERRKDWKDEKKAKGVCRIRWTKTKGIIRIMKEAQTFLLRLFPHHSPFTYIRTESYFKYSRESS